MKPTAKLAVRRRTDSRPQRTPEELAEIRAVRQRFQRDKPGLEEILAATGQEEAMPLGEYLRAQELLLALRKERARQQVTLAQMAAATGYDPAVLSRLLSGRQVNTTLATITRLANALGKEVVHTLRDMPPAGRPKGPIKRKRITSKAGG
jgi:hypothetical protein